MSTPPTTTPKGDRPAEPPGAPEQHGFRRVLHVTWRIVKPLGLVLIALVVLAGLVVISTLSPNSGTVKSNLNAVIPAATQTTGPIIGDQSLMASEMSCMKSYVANPANNMVNYPPSLGAPEHTDSLHTGVYPCAHFTGSLTGTNQVFKYQSETSYDQNNLIVFDGPNNGYLLAGGSGPPSSGSFVVKFNPSTGEQVWKTPLQNVNINGGWLAFGSMAVQKDHTIAVAAGPDIWRLNPKTGDIIAAQTQPVPASSASDANWDGFQIAPDAKGTILLKSQTRPKGCPTQGNAAMSSCQKQYGAQPNTSVVAADPKTLKNLDAIKLNQSVTARPIVVAGPRGLTYMYLAGNSSGTRVIWNPSTQKLSVDNTWAPKYLIKGQEGGTAPGMLGDWVIFNANANPSKTTPICVTVVNQNDVNNLHRICPWGKKLPSGVTSSETPASVGIDPQNSMIYVQDWLVNGVYGIKLNQQTGDMKIAWSRKDWRTSDYFSLVGPANNRVLISQYLNPDFKTSQIAGYAWTESVLWANAATGKTIAQSAYGPSTALGSLPNVGYGGRLYMMGNDGSIFIYQVEPKSSTSGS